MQPPVDKRVGTIVPERPNPNGARGKDIASVVFQELGIARVSQKVKTSAGKNSSLAARYSLPRYRLPLAAGGWLLAACCFPKVSLAR